MSARRFILPLPGPLDVDPAVMVSVYEAPELRDIPQGGSLGEVTAAAMLDTAVAGLVLGAYDTQVLTWLRGKGIGTVAGVASLLRRAWLAGVAEGRRERLDESEVSRDLRDHLTAMREDLTEARCDAVALVDALTRVIGGPR